ncbi:mammalian cell entry protein (plasmid) [Rhodococcus oxybenzonivorans]|jgi:phospholipid/cholesterol/gamma-HCH transport system substrate-binding protein|uniref:Mammalian cell entry protein n=1 Tax=Rhodococcus oxybenzonivorans TaxID=1990687 RepID=A0A2S2C853_9NOCA|nr:MULTISPECIES: MCE family protein [Rhodococcus]AWK77014.1 mammalian cell entry protein [Rhodococcus oxybenzonivorans]QTJ71328.1 MCE family protein [Rhodococcus sp. ZPP]
MKGTRRPTVRMPAKVLLLIVVIVAVVAGTGAWVANNATHHISAYFRSATGLYVGDRVMILGVEVGRVNEIAPEGDRVRIEFEYDGDYDVPADAQAVIVAPVLVTGRYIQLAPAYTGGEKMQDGQTIPVERTAVPVEFDEVKEQVVKLAQDVGRTPENPNGSLNDFVSNTADTLRGNGQTLHDSLVKLSDASSTLSKGGEDLFASVRNLQSFTSALAANEQQITAFSRELATTSSVLNANRTELDALLNSMLVTFGEVTQFLQDNRGALTTDVGKLTDITRQLVDREDALASILHTAPTTLSNFYNIYDPDSNSLTAAIAVSDTPDPRSLICALLTTVDAPADECIKTTGALATGLVQPPGAPAPSGGTR